MGSCCSKDELVKNSERQTAANFERQKKARLSTIPVAIRSPSEPLQQFHKFRPVDPPESPGRPNPPELQPQVPVLHSRVTVSGVLSESLQDSFQSKKYKSLGQDFSLDQISTLGLGVACKKGLKDHAPNQDDFSIVIDQEFCVIGVFDGHGAHGHYISDYVKNKLTKLLLAHETFNEAVNSALCSAFEGTHNSLKRHCHKKRTGYACKDSGTTATVGVVKDGVLYMAHVGDSRAVLGNNHDATILTNDHKPNNPGESERILSSGGIVKRLPDDIPYRVFAQNSDGPGLSVSRAIGDSTAHTLGVVATPEISELRITEEMEYLIICSDGVWEFISGQEALKEVAKCGTNCKLAAERLARLAWSKWIEHEGDVVDDITAIVLYLPLFLVH